MVASPFLSLILLILLPIATSSGVYSDLAALIILRTANPYLQPRWDLSHSHCNWPGVQCTSGPVANLFLPGFLREGSIPAGTIGMLTSLIHVDLSNNSLSGPIPTDVGDATQLQYLVLPFNKLSGAIPPSLSNLRHLVILNLGHNNLSGPIPDLHLPRLMSFDVSYNQLEGEIPAHLHKWPEIEFLGNAGLCGRPLAACPTTQAQQP